MGLSLTGGFFDWLTIGFGVCTIVILHRVVAGLPVVIAANRDEMLARAASGPQLVAEVPHRIVAGVDRQRGGSWMGLTDRGGFVGLTNQRSFSPPDPDRASRGHIVLNALACPDAEAMRRHVAGLDGRDYNGFNLLFGDATGLYAAYGRPEHAHIEIEPVPPGVHVLPNDRLDAPMFPKVGRAIAAADRAVPWPALRQELALLLGDHAMPAIDDVDEPPPGSRFDRAFVQQLHAICIHTPVYGTRSATIAALREGGVAAYWYAEGPPCVTPFADYTPLVRGSELR